MRPPRGVRGRLRLRGITSNRDAIGALVRAKIDGRTSSALVKTGSSYLSQSELPITFGVGSGKGADEVTIDWPGGKREALDVKVGDRILFGKYSGTTVKIEGTEYLVMREEDIMGVVA